MVADTRTLYCLRIILIKSRAMQIVSKYLFIAVLAMLPVIATASVDSPSFSCSSTFVVSFDNGYQASCDGDFTFDSGTLMDDTFIRLTSLRSINLNSNVTLIAPFIELQSPIINIASGAVLDAGFIGLPTYFHEVNVPYIFEPKKPLIVSQVPEPSSLSLLAMGLFCVVMVVRRKSKRS